MSLNQPLRQRGGRKSVVPGTTQRQAQKNQTIDGLKTLLECAPGCKLNCLRQSKHHSASLKNLFIQKDRNEQDRILATCLSSQLSDQNKQIIKYNLAKVGEFLPVEVCRNFFISSFGYTETSKRKRNMIGDGRINTVLNLEKTAYKKSENQIIKERNKILQMTQHLKKQRSIPAHYQKSELEDDENCRRYLTSNLNTFPKLWEDYNNEVEKIDPALTVSLPVYREFVKKNSNISLREGGNFVVIFFSIANGTLYQVRNGLKMPKNDF